MGFQEQVNSQQAPAVAGDFASANPRAAVLAGEAALVAGDGGVTVGRFAWVDDDGKTVFNHGTATRKPNGFVHRDQQALISTYLAEASNLIPEGFMVTLFNEGDFWATVTGSIAAAIGDSVYATYADGNITMTSAATGAAATGSIGATMTASNGATFTATGTGTSLVVTSLTGYLAVGDTISGTGVPVGTTITAQTVGTTGAAGTYTTSVATTASSATVTSFGTNLHVTAITGFLSVGDELSAGPAAARVTAQTTGTAGSTGNYTLDTAAVAYTASGTITAFGDHLHVTAVASGSIKVGDPVSGTGVPSGAVIATQVDGTTGGAGNYTLDQRASAYAASTALTVVAGVDTGWKAQSVAAVGELVKISTWGI